MYSSSRATAVRRALVVFHGKSNCWYAGLLAPGFRHCFVCLLDDDSRIWIRFDGQAGVPSLHAVAAGEFDLAGFYRAEGFTVVERDITQPARSGFPLMTATCVGAAKRLLGIRAPFAQTPLQLYRLLR